MAEREGFEPSVRKAHNGFRDRPVQPLRHLSSRVRDHTPGPRRATRPDQRPFHCGLRFSAKARGPSMASSESIILS